MTFRLRSYSLLFSVLTALVASGVAQATDFYASPSGSSGGSGTLALPWDLTTALNSTGKVKPGDTVWLRGGVYKGNFLCTLLGSASAPIKVRAYPNERPILDGNLAGQAVKNVAVLKVPSGGYVWIWGLELTNSDPERVLGITGSNPQERRGNAIDVYAPGVKLINLVIHDAGQGMGGWSQAQDMEAYGNLVFNNGWWAPDRGHGHGLYTQNDVGQKLYKHNVIINQFGNTISMYGSSAAFLRNFVFDGNLLFNGRVLMGGNTPMEGLIFKNNLTYNTPMEFGYGAPGNLGIDINNNYLAGGLAFKEIDQVTVKNNYVYNTQHNASISIVLPSGATLGNFNFDYNQYNRAHPFGSDFWQPGLGENFTQWQSHGEDPHSSYSTSAPSGVVTFITPNQYDANRAMVVIYNWAQNPAVTVDLSSVLSPGDKYELRSVLDYFGDVITGTYNGGTVSVPMANHSFAIPLGYNQLTSYNTYPTFGGFILVKQPAGVQVTAVSPSTQYLEPSQTVQLAATVSGTTNTAVTWSISPARGSISAGGLYTAPANIVTPETVYVTATSVADPSQSMSSPITLFPVQQSVTFSITPATVTLQAKQQIQFVANVTGTTTAGATWAMSPFVGTLSSTGLYTAPSTVTTPQTITITGTSVIDTTKSATATINLVPVAVAVTTAPATVSLQASKTAQFTATVTGTTNTAVTWSVSPSTGAISATGLYTAPSSISSAQAVIVKATSVADPNKVATSTVNLAPSASVAVSVSPATASLTAAKTAQFTAAVTGSTNTSVTWSISPVVGSISTSGLYTAPATVTSAQSVTVKATSVADTTKSASATISLAPTAVVAVSVSPATASLTAAKTAQFAAAVTGSSNTAVTWSLNPAVGSISSTGLYTAPSSITTAQTVSVKAVSAADTTKSASAVITLSPTTTGGGTGTSGGTVAVTVNPATGSVQLGKTLQLAANVTGSTNTAVNWSLSPALGSISSTGVYTAPATLPSSGGSGTPAFQMGTYVGGSGHETLREALFDSAGNIVVVGYTQSPASDFPTATKIGTVSGGQHAIVAKLTPSGSLIWMTLIGGSGMDGAYGLALDSSDNLYIAGFTGSTDFPTTPGAYSRTHSGGTSSLHGATDVYGLKLTPDGKQLIFSTFLGGSHNETARGGLDIDSAGNMYIVGNTESPDFLGNDPAKVNSYLGGPSDGFLVKLAFDGSKVVYARFIGGSDNGSNVAENVVRVKVDSQGQAHVASVVGSTDAITTPGAFSRTLKGGADTYVAKFSADGKQVLYGTYLGGTSYEYQEHAMVLDSAGNAYIAGYTTSTDFPTVNAQQSAPGGGGSDLYFSKIGTSGQLLFSTYIGGSGSDGTIGGSAIDASGNVYLFGTAGSSNFGVTANALQPTMHGSNDGFLRQYSSTGQLLYSSYFGGMGTEVGRSAGISPNGTVVVVGETDSSDLQTSAGAFDKTYAGNSQHDAFVATFTGIAGGSSATSAVVTVTATSAADSTKSASATLTVTQNPVVAVSVTPGTASLQQSQTQQFAASVTGSTNTAVTWTLSPAVGSISSTGLYTAPASITTAQTVTVTATSVADSTKSATATVSLAPAAVVAVSVAPGTASLQAGNTQQFAATVTGSTNTAVTWTLSPAVGSISASGLYTAPASITSAQTVTVKATSAADSTKSATATVNLTPVAVVAVSVTPNAASLQASQSQQFTAAVTGSTNTAVTWSLSPAVGTITTAGLYKAPSSVTSAQTVTVKATSVADATKSATATVSLTPVAVVAVSVTPGTASLQASQSQQFTAAVTGSTNTAVTWTISPAVGTISTAGLYQAPTSVTSAQSVTVKATSAADATKSATAVVSLTPPAAPSTGNLLADGGFENGGTAWNAYNNGGRSVITTQHYTGSAAEQIQVTDQFDRVVYQDIPVTAGKTVNASAWIQTSGAASGASADLMWLNSTTVSDMPASTNILRTDLLGTVSGTAAWTKLSGQFVAPAGAKCLRVRLYTRKAAVASGTAWFDEIAVQ